MSKIERFQGDVKAFASNAQGLERTVFGGTTQANDLTSQVTAAFLRGWGVVGPSEHPSLEDFNAAMYAMSQFIAYQHQVGVPEWHAEQEYHVGSVCTHGGISYQSLDNENIGNEPPSAKWSPVLTAKNGGDYFQPKNGNLTSLSGLTGAADRLPHFTAANVMALTALTAFARELLAQSDAAGVLTKLGLEETVNLAKNALAKNAVAVAAAKLSVARLINGVSFDGSANINLPLIGYGQSWVDVTSQRSIGATYTNSTGRPIQIILDFNRPSSPWSVNVVIDGLTANGAGSYCPIIPAGSTYRVAASGVSTVTWRELR